jgi:hypothetical protein
MLGKLNAIRTACTSNLETIGLKKFSGPDIIKLSMALCVGKPEYAVALKADMKKDGIHFTESGHSCIAYGLSAHFCSLKPCTSEKISAAVFPISGAQSSRKPSFYWRGFVSPVGAGRLFNHKAAYLQCHCNPTAARGSGGGKWVDSISNTSSASNHSVSGRWRTKCGPLYPSGDMPSDASMLRRAASSRTGTWPNTPGGRFSWPAPTLTYSARAYYRNSLEHQCSHSVLPGQIVHLSEN